MQPSLVPTRRYALSWRDRQWPTAQFRHRVSTNRASTAAAGEPVHTSQEELAFSRTEDRDPVVRGYQCYILSASDKGALALTKRWRSAQLWQRNGAVLMCARAGAC